MRDRLIELIKDSSQYINEQDGLVECLADHLLANGVIVPHYKCGTTVYVLRSQTSNGENLYMRKERIDHYRTFNNGTFMIFESGRISVRNDQWNGSVFATQEEAEQAMKGEHHG